MATNLLRSNDYCVRRTCCSVLEYIDIVLRWETVLRGGIPKNCIARKEARQV